MLYRTQLQSQLQREGESLHSLAQDILHLMVLTYPGLTIEMSGTVATVVFLDAVINSELALREYVIGSRLSWSWLVGSPCVWRKTRVQRTGENQ